MLGSEGLEESTKIAILNANYLRTKLSEHYPVLYTGENGFVGHEMIVDFKSFKAKGIEVIDIAKRLMDYGYHAPTVSFPVHDTLMIEPTESENKAELDRFIEAMVSIKKEIDAHAFTDHNSVLKNAPHTQEMLTADEWPYSYSRKEAAFPLDYIKENKFWPFVRRVNDAYGDRNLVCSCNPIEDYID
jgi:glycine dehydrogenase